MAALPTTVIFETLHGSRAYNLDTPTSDTDLKGIVVGPREWYLGYLKAPEQLELSPDHVRYDLRKFMRLAAAGNPTLIELLWTRPAHHRVVTAEGEELLAMRTSLLSRRVAQRFCGYAMSQLKRIRSHRSWLLSPPKGEPSREIFGLPPTRAVTADQEGAAKALEAQGVFPELPENFIELLNRERRYQQARRHWDQWRTWQRERNPVRAQLEARHGYDTKHAMHLVRLLRMGLEILRTGRVAVWREDRSELLAIRGGAWSYHQLVERAEALHTAVRSAEGHSPLPPAPDDALLNRLCADLVERTLSR